MEYEKEYHELKHKHLYINKRYYKARSELARRRYFIDIEDLKNKNVLEFGVGLGHNIAALPTKKKVGYDISKFAVDFCNSNGVLSTTNIDKIPDNTFDVVLCAHVLEHVENPLKTLAVVHSKLRKGGQLILITPIEKFKRVGNWQLKLNFNQHLYSWTPQQMINLLIKAGFKPISNEVIPTCGHKKLLWTRRLGLWCYDVATAIAGSVVRSKELKFVAVKT